MEVKTLHRLYRRLDRARDDIRFALEEVDVVLDALAEMGLDPDAEEPAAAVGAALLEEAHG